MTETQPRNPDAAPSDPEAGWTCIVNSIGPLFPHKGATIKIKALAELVSLAGMQMKAQVLAWRPVEGVMLDVQGICYTAEAKLSRRPEEVEFTVRKADGETAVVTLPYDALGCVYVRAPS